MSSVSTNWEKYADKTTVEEKLNRCISENNKLKERLSVARRLLETITNDKTIGFAMSACPNEIDKFLNEGN